MDHQHRNRNALRDRRLDCCSDTLLPLCDTVRPELAEPFIPDVGYRRSSLEPRVHRTLRRETFPTSIAVPEYVCGQSWSMGDSGEHSTMAFPAFREQARL
jgi:hypothetical protein